MIPVPLWLLFISVAIIAGYFLGYHDGILTTSENYERNALEDQTTNPQS